MTVEDYIALVPSQHRGRFLATSTTEVAIPTVVSQFGTTPGPVLVALEVADGLDARVGWRVRATSAANAANWFEGSVADYRGTSLVLVVDRRGDESIGTFADWQLVGRSRFLSTLAALIAPLVRLQEVVRGFPADHDIDTAIGKQLDTLGLWIGRTRFVNIPIPNFFFTWDTVPAEGWDGGRWLGEFVATESQYTLLDPDYRRLLKGKIAANNWKGDRAGQYHTLAEAFGARGSVLIQDGQDMTQTVLINTGALSEVERALLTKEYVPIRPAGVEVNFEDYYLPPFEAFVFRGGVLVDDELLEVFAGIGETVLLDADDWLTANAWLPFTSETVIVWKKNGVEFATVTFPAGGVAPVAGVVSMTDPETEIGPTDLVSVHGPEVADATGGDLGFTIYGTRLPPA